MFWADRIAKDIIDSGQHKPYWVDDMFTPSGFAHIGSLRGPLVHDTVFRALRDAVGATTSTYIFNDFDPIDGLPPELEQSSPYLGFPLRLAPSPVDGYSSFADYFTQDFQKVLKNLGVQAEFRSSWDMYHAGMFDGVIREALDNAVRIQDIYQRVSGSKKRDKGWLPLQVVCKQCHKLGTTRVHGWDGTMVTYACEPTMVAWAKGCGYTGVTSPFTDPKDTAHHPGKLPWKVDWPAHWKVLGVTIEGAGKDHSSAGGSRDIAKELCKEVFHYPNPYNIPYEFFLIGGKKMSSSKGLGLKARDLTSLLPASVGRFLFTRTDYKQAIEFDPIDTMAIPDLFDEYDRCWEAYNTGSDDMLARVFVLSQIAGLPEKKNLFFPRFRDVANYLQLPNIDLQQKLEQVKGSVLTAEELNILKEREQYARVWIGRYAPSVYRLQMSDVLPPEAETLTEKQKEFLKQTIELIQKDLSADVLQVALYELSKTVGVEAKDAFAALYTAFLGKTHGPRAAWFLLQYPKVDVLRRLQEATQVSTIASKGKESNIATISRPDFFCIDPEVKQRFPSVTVGIALINDVSIQKTDPQLEKEKQETIASFGELTTEQLGTYSEVLSYRTLYKEMGIDWHSRRPSPEALLRRVAQGKGLYTVNTCVDAYNLVVLKHRISVGAFDAAHVQFPTVLRFARGGDEILLLGDDKPTQYTARELAYYDQQGGYNIDFNFRDAQRTKVTEETKNIWINVDGIGDITPKQVEAALKETIRMITKYCGGRIVFQGIAT